MWMVSLAIGVTAACGGDPESSGGRNGATYAGSGGSGGMLGSSGQGGLGGLSIGEQPGGNGAPLAGIGGSGGEDNTCAGAMITASRIFPTVMLVVDGSSSMRDPYGTIPNTDAGVPDPNATLPSRWQSVREAVVGSEGVVPKLQDRVKFGLAVFGTNSTCPLPLGVINPDFNNGAAIASGLPNQPPGMFTPTGVALDQVVDLLPDPLLVLDGPPIGPQIILLATDGNPNACDAFIDIFTGTVPTDYNPSINAAMKAAAKNLKMYVVSVGQDAAAAHLQEMANIGQGMDRATGTAEVYYPEDTAGLTDTLETLIGAELSCELKLEGKGVKVGKECTGKVLFNGTELECNGENGFVLLDSFTIELKGTTCETFKNSIDSSLQADFPCDAIVVE